MLRIVVGDSWLPNKVELTHLISTDMKDLKLKATFSRFTNNGGVAYRVESLSRDAKTAQAEMEFFYENYTLENERRSPNTYYDNSGQPFYDEAEIRFEENVANGKAYFNLYPSLDLIREASLNALSNRGNQGRRAVTRRAPEPDPVDNNDDPEL